KYTFSYCISFKQHRHHIHLHSFPTRRSSDLSTMKKVVKKMDDIYNVNDGKALPLMKHEIQERIDTNQPVKPLEIVKKVLESDGQDRKSTRLNSSHVSISYAVFCLKKKKK